jgi:hypothetical protein
MRFTVSCFVIFTAAWILVLLWLQLRSRLIMKLYYVLLGNKLRSGYEIEGEEEGNKH